METKSKEAKRIGGIVFIGCMFIGIGLGFYYDSIVVGTLIGMGIGFLAMAGIIAYYKNKDNN